MTTPNHHRVQWTRADRIAWIAFGVASVGLFALVFLWVAFRGQQDRIGTLKGQVNAFAGGVSTANSRLADLGAPTVPVPASAPAPTATVTVTGAQGDQGPGPSDSQVAAAVVQYCNNHQCSTPPSSSDVAAAVAGYCAAHSGCIGATGPQGAAGQNATTDQIANAVQSYCSANSGCQGPTGAQGGQGPAGAQGATGPEIPSFTFTVPGAFPGTSTTYICNAPTYQCVAQ